MKRWLAALVVIASHFMWAQVVINEVCYDAAGADNGKEWIELYNATDGNIDLSGCKIYSGGNSFEPDFEFPYYVLRPYRFVVVGGTEVTEAHFIHNFSFQNGGNASDGIRFLNADSSYTDTVIYDSPNTNLLPDDSGLPATSCAEDAPEGCSLARVTDGVDSDLCAQDFIVETQPTPGLPNSVYADYALLRYQFSDLDGGNILQLYIGNLSPYMPAAFAQLRLYNEAQLLHYEEISPIAAGAERIVEIWLDESYPLLYAELELESDPNPQNNSLYISAMGQEVSALVISEIFPAPESGKQEWIELYAEPASKSDNNYLLLDEANNSIAFTLPEIPGYFVLCRDQDALLQDYPQCPAGFVIEVSSWAPLNNDGDSLLLCDESGDSILDAVSYNAAQAINGMAIQRVLNQEDEVVWRVGNPNPGQDNNIHLQDLPDHDQTLKIFGSPCDPRKGEAVTISYKLPDPENTVTCNVYDLYGHKIRCLADNQLIANEGLLSWDARKQNGSIARRGIYIILWESQSGNKAGVMRKQLSAVIK